MSPPWAFSWCVLGMSRISISGAASSSWQGMSAAAACGFLLPKICTGPSNADYVHRNAPSAPARLTQDTEASEGAPLPLKRKRLEAGDTSELLQASHEENSWDVGSLHHSHIWRLACGSWSAIGYRVC